MAANMGQFNYISSNSYLDKLPFYERPELDSFTLMWGPVGAIGMRAKAFASQDMLNFAPENLMSILDASKILHMVTCRMDPPEWFNPCFFDMGSRESFLKPTAGVIQGEDYARPSQPLLSKEHPEPRGLQAEAMGPLGGWPGLVDPMPEAPDELVAPLELCEGAPVELTGLPSQSGLRGTVLKKHADGRWKVLLDGGLG
eukprot:CAMPEP_0168423166 /NCGR_PEP_ID=MMETSP0228-20121227/34168_1 /TAXON_ID=133427 /ORGANISM="Protoceratium reticulatum, Strain CCCM 535 (=CCMP 1889)" /LENGTH=198 /DNA_ID=CAMNT_0008437119 /DNA_START=45 /DNA_END=637 /DNA_ORIENTATION=+